MDRDKKRNIVVILGAPRSGTTLVNGLISGGASASPMLPECTYITQVIRQFHDFLNYSDPQRFVAYAKNKETLGEMYQRLVSEMIAVAESNFVGVDYENLILKDPELTLFPDLIMQFLEIKPRWYA